MQINKSVSSFFAGIGGFDLAFERQGFRSVFQCEINEFCNSVLEHHWPNVKRHKDIRTLQAKDIRFRYIFSLGINSLVGSAVLYQKDFAH